MLSSSSHHRNYDKSHASNNNNNNNHNTVGGIVTFKQARAILFGLSTISFIISFVLVLLLPDVNDMNEGTNNGDHYDERYDPIVQHLQYEKEHYVGNNNNVDINHKKLYPTSRIHQATNKRRSQPERIPEEIYDVMLKQQEIHQQEQLKLKQDEEELNQQGNIVVNTEQDNQQVTPPIIGTSGQNKLPEQQEEQQEKVGNSKNTEKQQQEPPDREIYVPPLLLEGDKEDEEDEDEEEEIYDAVRRSNQHDTNIDSDSFVSQQQQQQQQNHEQQQQQDTQVGGSQKSHYSPDKIVQEFEQQLSDTKSEGKLGLDVQQQQQQQHHHNPQDGIISSATNNTTISTMNRKKSHYSQGHNIFELLSQHDSNPSSTDNSIDNNDKNSNNKDSNPINLLEFDQQRRQASDVQYTEKYYGDNNNNNKGNTFEDINFQTNNNPNNGYQQNIYHNNDNNNVDIARSNQQMYMSVKRGDARSTMDNNLFVVLADENVNGVATLFDILNEHNQICCPSSSTSSNNNEVYTADGQKVVRNGFPMNAFTPSETTSSSTTTDLSISNSCTIQFLWDQIPKMVRHLTTVNDPNNRRNMIMVPRSCIEINPANPLYPNHILERLCHFITKLNGNFSKTNIVSNFVTSMVQSPSYNPRTPIVNQLDFGCLCTDTTTRRGIYIASNWPQSYVTSLFNTTQIYGSKIILLSQPNLFVRYLSALLSNITHISYNDNTNKNDNAIEEQILQFLRFHRMQLNINIYEMIQNMKLYQEQSRSANDLAKRYGSDIMYIDSNKVHANLESIVQQVSRFLQVDGIDITTLQASTSTVRTLLQSSSYASSKIPFSKVLDEFVTNKNVVIEALIANGWGEFIFQHGGSAVIGGSSNTIPIHHIIYGSESEIRRRPLDAQIGINTSYVANVHRDEVKYTSILPTLLSMAPETLVVISNGQGISISNHIRSTTNLFESMANFRTEFIKLINSVNDNQQQQQHPYYQTNAGTIVIAADTRCCATALTHFKPGGFFSQDGKRLNRSCSPRRDAQQSNDFDCHWLGDEYALPWQVFMKELAIDRTGIQSNNVYLDTSLIGGFAKDLIRLFQDADIYHTEDEQAVLTDFMYNDKTRIVLDYEQKIFGKAFEGLRSKITIKAGCVGGGEALYFDQEDDELSGHSKLPFFLSERRDLNCFQTNHAVQPNNDSRFPVWDSAGIKLKPILDHIDRFFIQGVSLPGLIKMRGTEVLYVVDNGKVLVSHRRGQDKTKMVASNKLILSAYDEVLKQVNSGERWSSLRAAIQSIGFPFFAWYGEFKGCCNYNFGGESVPLLTNSAQIDCKYAFPMPSSTTISESKPDIESWYNLFKKADDEYPYITKIRKAAWRGSLSADDPSKVFDSPIWRLAKLVYDRRLDSFDVGIDEIPAQLSRQMYIDTSIIGGLKPKMKSRSQLQRYLAIIDVDGDSSSRSTFATSLCYNSVVIKVEPTNVDYFYYDLKPWKHYIPVKADLSDLIENVAFALNPTNDPIIKDIVSSANQLCAERYVTEQLVHDMLDIWDYYTHMLDVYDPGWKQQWAEKKSLILSSQLYSLVPLADVI